MKIFAVADTHIKHRNITVPEGDIFIFAGDMIDFTNRFNLYVDFNDWLGTISCKYKIIVAGNHDELFQKNPAEIRAIFTNCIYLQDEEIVINGVKFYGSPWTPEYPLSTE